MIQVTIKTNMMSKTYETGHAENVANLETLVTYVNGYGAVYNPGNANILLSNLTFQR